MVSDMSPGKTSKIPYTKHNLTRLTNRDTFFPSSSSTALSRTASNPCKRTGIRGRTNAIHDTFGKSWWKHHSNKRSNFTTLISAPPARFWSSSTDVGVASEARFLDNASPRVTFSSSWLSVDISPFSDSFVLDDGISLTAELAGDTETWNQEKARSIPRNNLNE